jgi:hypothetical protein
MESDQNAGKPRTAAPAGVDGQAEHRRIAEMRDRHVPWFFWGPYLSERQWGTVREDYSPDGAAWDYFPFEHAHARAYRWSEDGMLGICDNLGRLCFALALWNEADPILKERMFGLSGTQGNHGEDVKEYYFFLDCTPSHSYMKALYKYPQRAFPYADLLTENRRRNRGQPEYELMDTGVFSESRYFDVVVEYAKADPEDVLIRITATNRGPAPAPLHLLPTLWFWNTWAWGSNPYRPELRIIEARSGGGGADHSLVRATHEIGEFWLACGGAPPVLFTENETNFQRLYGVPNRTPSVKDGIQDAVVHGRMEAVNSIGTGTKAAAHYARIIGAGSAEQIELRLSSRRHERPFADSAEIFARRQAEADAFYRGFGPEDMPEDARRVQRQAFAGLLWSKQFYRYDVSTWLDGDPAGPRPPESRKHGRNAEWRHLDNAEVISMPDTWEFPWYAAWDLAFHCIPLALVDPELAKRQLILLLREWYMHPSGQLPAYEWAFGDVNPPVHAWAAWRVYKIAKRMTGTADRAFLERVFHKLLLNFTWWVNRKDIEGRNVFQGGFLGLDNIGVFDRGQPLPNGGHLDQADGTAWMGMFCLNMLAIALELARADHAYEDVATKFLQHFLYIAAALNDIGSEGIAMWDGQDEFFYDVMHSDGQQQRLRVRSLVGALPLMAVETIEPALLDALPDFKKRLEWFLAHRPHLAGLVSRWYEPGMGERRMFALVRGHRMKRVLRRLLDPAEFLSDHGLRSISRYHADHPYDLNLNGMTYTVGYEPAESRSGLFGGNSNWRGPVWFPLNFLILDALQRFHHYYGDDFLVECPTGSGTKMTLWGIAEEIGRRLMGIFLRGPDGRRPVFGTNEIFQTDPHWRDYVLFHEYFHGDTGAGLGASHQTGWTALVAKLLEQTRHRGEARPDPLDLLFRG